MTGRILGLLASSALLVEGLMMLTLGMYGCAALYFALTHVVLFYVASRRGQR